MKKLILIAICILTVSVAAFAQRMTKDANPCESIKGKTYIGWSSGKFDDNPDAAGASRLVFDAKGKGTARSFLSFTPNDTSGSHQILDITCGVLQGAGNLNGKSYLNFKIAGGLGVKGVDAGNILITSYDNGAKVWVEAATPGRPMKGWMLQLPANPPVSENIIK